MTAYLVDANVWVGAFASGDRWQEDSIRFLAEAGGGEHDLIVPALALVEIACAIRRRSGSAEVGRAAYEALLSHPALTVQSLDSDLILRSITLGLELGLRGADAIYAATSDRTGAPLVTWDQELLDRVAGARSPSSFCTP